VVSCAGGIPLETFNKNLLLAARPPSRLQHWLAYGVMAALLAIFCITAPYAKHPLQPVTAFIPVYANTMAIIDLIAAALIFAQFWVVRWMWLLVLASGFLFTALIAIPFALTFPGVFSPDGLLGAGVQTAAWLAVFWHLGSPFALIVAMLVRGSGQSIGTYRYAPGTIIVLSIVLVMAIVCGLTWVLVAYDDILPRIYAVPFAPRYNGDIFILMIALSAFALILLWLRGRSVLDLWLRVLCCSWIFELALAGFFGGGRFTLGWYTGRIFEMLAASIVLLLFLSETTALYATMARSAIERSSIRRARRIAMDAMAASIGHEINQPLASMTTNASAGMRLATRVEPDMKEIHTTFSDIAAQGQRIREIIDGIRTMFKKSAHDRQLLNVNKVIGDTLALVEFDTLLQRVIVKTNLDEDLPPLSADSGQLHQVLQNLITNALQAMSEVTDRACVLTVTSGLAAGSSEIAVTVEDTGIGIPPDDSNRIFDPFFSTKISGSGIGLTICRVIVEGHGGKLEVRANEPYGTILRVILPVRGGE